MNKEQIHQVKEIIKGNPHDIEKLEEALNIVMTSTEIHNRKEFTDRTLESVNKKENELFHDWYIQSLTSNFGEEIDGLRKGMESFTGSSEDLSSMIAILRTGQSPAVFDDIAKNAVVSIVTNKKKSLSKVNEEE